MSRERISLGKQGEDLAASYLRNKCYKIIQRNYRQKSGEIDIIARDRDTLIFVEVKTRKNLSFGRPFESVTPKKQSQLTRIALDYMTRNRLTEEAVRFDVISILMSPDGEAEIEHLANCFEATGAFY